MIIEKVSETFERCLNRFGQINYANLELRPRGVIVHLNNGKESFSWPIAFHQLSIIKSDGMSVHANGNFIQVLDNKNFRENKSFFDKLFHLKNKYLSEMNCKLT